MVTMKALLKQSNKSYKHTSHGRELISFEAQLFVAFDIYVLEGTQTFRL